MKIFYGAVAMTLIALMFAGCCACRKGKNNLPLKGTEWHLMRMMGRDLAIDGEQFVFTFSEDGQFGGTGACNRMFGEYKSDAKGALTFGPIASTRRMCPDANLETEFSAVLSRATHYEVDGNILMIFSNGEMQAILMAK